MTKPKSLHALAAMVSLVLAVALSGGVAPSATAAGNELLVSTDGVNFSPGSTLSLFTRMGRVVPGDRSTERVWVKNASQVDAVLRIDLVDPRSDDAALAAAFSLSVVPQGGQASPPVTIEAGASNGACTALGGGMTLGPGESLRLDVTASVDAALAEQHGMLGTVGFSLRAVLIESTAAEEVPPGNRCQTLAEPVEPPTQRPGQLPNTGSAALMPLGVVAVAAVMVGVLLGTIGWRRRDPADEDDRESGNA